MSDEQLAWLQAACAKWWRAYNDGQGEADMALGRTPISREKLDMVRRRLREHKSFMALADRSEPGDALLLMQQTGFFVAAVPYLLDEIERLRATR